MSYSWNSKREWHKLTSDKPPNEQRAACVILRKIVSCSTLFCYDSDAWVATCFRRSWSFGWWSSTKGISRAHDGIVAKDRVEKLKYPKDPEKSTEVPPAVKPRLLAPFRTNDNTTTSLYDRAYEALKCIFIWGRQWCTKPSPIWCSRW